MISLPLKADLLSTVDPHLSGHIHPQIDCLVTEYPDLLYVHAYLNNYDWLPNMCLDK